LKIHINHLTILIHGSPKVVLLAVDPDKYFIDVKRITVAPVFSLQPT
jgi:hypothetical protein